MDLVTQATLGAAIGEVGMGRKIGNWGAACGAGLGLLPDADVLFEAFFDPVQQFLVHRSLTHSLLFMTLAIPLISWLLYRKYRDQKISWGRWAITVGLILSTHVLLDMLNNYGTLLFFPFSIYPVNLNTIFVIDPLYTLPLFVGLIVALFLRRTSRLRRTAISLGLFISSLYLVWAVFAKVYATEQFQEALDRQKIEYSRLMTTPSPLNTLLWVGFAEQNDTLHVGLYSIRDKNDRITFEKIPKRSDLLRYTSHELPMKRVIWFSRGFYTVQKKNGALYFYDLRFGRSDVWMDNSGSYTWGYRFELSDDGRRILDFKRQDPEFNLAAGFWSRYINRILGE